MKHNILVLITLLAYVNISAIGQQIISTDITTINRCSTMDVYHERLLANPSMETLDDFEEWMQNVRNTQAQNPNSTSSKQLPEIYTIPTIVHIIHDGEQIGSGSNISYAQILSQFDVLNEDFRRIMGTPGYNTNAVGTDSEIEFCPAEFDPDGNALAEPGVNRIDRSDAGFSAPSYSTNYIDNTIKPNTSWNPDSYMNVWVMTLGSGLLGYAQFPETSLGGLSTASQSGSTDGVVIGYQYFGRVGTVSAPFDEGRTATHEIGHYLGLRHIWGDGGCGADDFCDDTPASDGSNGGCSSTTSCGSTDMVENYMDYSDDACMNIFTVCQGDRMRFVMENSPRRNALLNSAACTPPTVPPIANFTANITAGCPGLGVQFFDQSSFNPDSWLWTFEGGTPSSSTDENPSVTYSNEGSFAVTLAATNTYGTGSNTLSGYIVISNNGVENFFVEDWESGGFSLNNWTIENSDNDVTWEITSTGGNTSGSLSARVDHYNYQDQGQRDALISDVFDFSGRNDLMLDVSYAHRRYSADYSDSLIVYISIDGGTTFTTRLFAGAEDGTGSFATGYTTTAQFVPSTSEDWCFNSVVGSPCISVDLSAYEGETNVRFKFETYNDYGNNIYLDDIILSGTCIDNVVVPSVLVKTNIWLEGAYNGSNMDNSLRTSDLLPNDQPYNTYPWNYLGIESNNNLPSDVVDWVLVEARDANDNSVVIERRAALLLQDGRIIDADGSSDGTHFYALTSGNAYHISIRHRNHLDIISNAPIILPNSNSYDFTAPNNVAGGNNQLANLGSSYGLYSGDITGNGIVSLNDFNSYLEQSAQSNQYLPADINLDGIVSIADFNSYLPNGSIIGINAIRY